MMDRPGDGEDSGHRRIFQQLPHSLLQGRKITLDNRPYCLQVDGEVIMHQDVPEAGDGPPIHLGMAPSGFFSQALCRLAEDLKVAENRIL